MIVDFRVQAVLALTLDVHALAVDPPKVLFLLTVFDHLCLYMVHSTCRRKMMLLMLLLVLQRELHPVRPSCYHWNFSVFAVVAVVAVSDFYQHAFCLFSDLDNGT